MSILLKLKNLKPADKIVVPKSKFRLIQHHAIYLGKDVDGTHWIAENKIGKGVQIITLSDFIAETFEITRIEQFTGTESERKQAVNSALALKGTNYNLLLFNCEHYANLVQMNNRESIQAKTGIALGLLGLFFLLLNVNDK